MRVILLDLGSETGEGKGEGGETYCELHDGVVDDVEPVAVCEVEDGL